MEEIIKRIINMFDSAKGTASDAQNRVANLESHVNQLRDELNTVKLQYEGLASAFGELADSFQKSAKPESGLDAISQALTDRGF